MKRMIKLLIEYFKAVFKSNRDYWSAVRAVNRIYPSPSIPITWMNLTKEEIIQRKDNVIEQMQLTIDQLDRELTEAKNQNLTSAKISTSFEEEVSSDSTRAK